MSEPGSATNVDTGDKPADDVEESAVAVSQAPPAPRAGRAAPTLPWTEKPWWVRHYTFTGTTVGLVFIWLSLTPSLLPRGPLFQGLVSGLSGAIGYGLGVFSVWLVRFMREKDHSPPPPRWAWKVLIPIGVVGQVLMAIWFHVWQDDVRDLMGVPHLEWYDYPLSGVLSLVVLFTVVEIGQFTRWLVRFLVGQVDRFVPFRLSATIVVVTLAVLTVTVLNGVVLKFAMRTMNDTFASANNEMNPDSAPPKTALRSGGPDRWCRGNPLATKGASSSRAVPRSAI